MTRRDDTRLSNGQFARTRHQPWTPERWGEGYADNRGRFRVYRPDFPRAYGGGYALRYHVVWWLAHGEPHPEGSDLHHINGDHTDDRLENLCVLGHVEHQRLHKPRTYKACAGCGAAFYNGKKPRAKYCSLDCYHAKPRTAEHKANIAAGLRRFQAGRK